MHEAQAGADKQQDGEKYRLQPRHTPPSYTLRAPLGRRVLSVLPRARAHRQQANRQTRRAHHRAHEPGNRPQSALTPHHGKPANRPKSMTSSSGVFYLNFWHGRSPLTVPYANTQSSVPAGNNPQDSIEH